MLSPFANFKEKNKILGKINKALEDIEQQRGISTEGEYEGYPLSNGSSVHERARMDTAAMQNRIECRPDINEPKLFLLNLGLAHDKDKNINRNVGHHGSCLIHSSTNDKIIAGN
jgi:hypothetical protein